jgi:hypothetical protein
MDDIISDVGHIKTDIATIKDDVSDAKAVTGDVKRWRLMGIGALGVVGVGGTAFGVSLASSFEWIAKLFIGRPTRRTKEAGCVGNIYMPAKWRRYIRL